ncbi:tonsoku-like protein [Ammospiza caudacuta]|uniref:tonsoku-like protein n=1 Tax=Ammospiza caudacuta TaxID=2857398 RepID=UPI0027382E16|nr:tonsoku-like protein [Ammospiza caudacuta]
MAGELSAEAAREIRQLEKSKEKSRRVGNAAEEAAACNRMGEILAANGRFEEALAQHREELQLLQGSGDTLGCAVAHRKVGECLAELHCFPQALQHQLQHLSLARSLSDAVEQQRAWATIGRTFLFMAEGPEIPEIPEIPEFPEFPAFHNSLRILETQLEGVFPVAELAQMRSRLRCPRGGGVVPVAEVAQMRSRLCLNLGLVQESLGNPRESSRLLWDCLKWADASGSLEDLGASGSLEDLGASGSLEDLGASGSLEDLGASGSLEDQFRAHLNLGLLQQRSGDARGALGSLGRARDCARKLGQKHRQGEALAHLGQVLLSLGDFEGARRALRRALRLGTDSADTHSVHSSLRHARRVCRCVRALSRADPAVPSLSLSLCERLGDSLARLGHFQTAAEYYEKQLSLAESLGLPGRELAVIHVSLGTTYRDLGEHGRALQHFQRELELRKGEPLEECRTWLNVALSLEDLGSPPAQLLPALQSALGCARAGGDRRLQLQVLRRLRAQQLRAGDARGALETLGELGGDPDNEEESDLELSESEDEDEDLEGYPKSVPGRRRRNQWKRRNAKGETALHRACIDGDARRVRLYLQQGHPVNPRDYVGWTPLHEAANHGHLEIVRLLLSHGAALDDPGGPGCEGVTPLHDALASGRFAVAQLLIGSGARLSARNARGQTPLQTLQEWLQNFGPELDSETWDSAQETLQILLEKAPPEEPEQPQIPNCSPSRKRQRTPDTKNAQKTQNPGKSSTENPEIPAENSHFPPKNSNVLPKNSNFSPENSNFWPENSNFLPQNCKPALIPEEEFLAQEDWLEDDLGPSRKKPRRNFREFREIWEPKIPKGKNSQNLGNSGPKVGSNSAEIPGFAGLASNSSEIPEFSGNSAEFSGDCAEIPEFSGNSSEVPEPSGNPNPTLRIRIQIQDELFLIPVVPSPSRTISWLCWAASQRFCRVSGTFPRLRLRRAGALLEPQDGVGAALSDGDTVQAEIQGWDLPPLPERYQRICASLGLSEPQKPPKSPHAALQRLLALQSLSPALELPAGVVPPRGHWAALLRALRLQEALRELRMPNARLEPGTARELAATLGTLPGLQRLALPGATIGPQGIHSLCQAGAALQALGTLPGLARLALPGATIGPQGIHSLCQAGAALQALGNLPGLARLALPGATIGPQGIHSLCQAGAALQSLQVLDLSLTPLGSSGGRAVAALLSRCPALATLQLRGCGIAEPFPIPEPSPLRSLSLSHNPLGRAGLRRLLRAIPARSLRSLELANVTNGGTGDRHGDVGDGHGDIGRDVAEYLQQAGCALCHLSLAGNHLRDGDIDELARSLPLCRSLLSLDLSANPGLGPGTFRNLLAGLERRGRGLELLSLAGCGLGELEPDGAEGKIRELRLSGRRRCRELG